MENQDMIINNIISFIIHLLGEIKKSGNEELSPLIEKIENLHREYKQTNSKDFLYKFLSCICDYKTYKAHLTSILTKICEVINSINKNIGQKYEKFHISLISNILELYKMLLKQHIKTYLKFKELDILIDYLKTSNSESINYEYLNSLSYNDPIIRIIISFIVPLKKQYGSFIEMLDMVLIPTQSILEDVSSKYEIFKSKESPMDILKQKRKEKHLSPTTEIKEEEVFTESVKIKHSSPITIVKEVEETNDEKIRKILNKYSKKSIVEMDKSPHTSPQNTMIKIIMDRDNV